MWICISIVIEMVNLKASPIACMVAYTRTRTETFHAGVCRYVGGLNLCVNCYNLHMHSAIMSYTRSMVTHNARR